MYGFCFWNHQLLYRLNNTEIFEINSNTFQFHFRFTFGHGQFGQFWLEEAGNLSSITFVTNYLRQKLVLSKEN
jgi:hypothetical protein